MEDIILPPNRHERCMAWDRLTPEQKRRVQTQERAYFLYLDRYKYGVQGTPLDDWLAAEQEENNLKRSAAERIAAEHRTYAAGGGPVAPQ